MTRDEFTAQCEVGEYVAIYYASSSRTFHGVITELSTTTFYIKIENVLPALKEIPIPLLYAYVIEVC